MTITLLGAEYGKHHVFPKVKSGRDLPPKSFDTTNDTLIVWVLEESQSNQSLDGEPLIFDAAESGCNSGRTEQYQMIRRSAYISAIQFDVFPRIDKKFHV